MFSNKKNKSQSGFLIQRQEMLEKQLKRRDIRSAAVLTAMMAVPRHLFIDDKHLAHAYDDGPLPIGYNQTISQPYIVASMSQYLDLNRKSKVLEIGTGCGYQTAVLAELAGEVYSIEIIPELHQIAKDNLAQFKFKNINLILGNGYNGFAEQAPFDGIILTAAPTMIPNKLIEQLAMDGRMVLPLAHSIHIQELIKIVKTKHGLKKESLYGVRFVEMTGEVD